MYAAYPVELIPTEGDRIMVRFPDVPSALTEAADQAAALHWAQDALVVAMSGYIDFDEDIPQPSPPKRGQHVVPLPVLVAAKLAIYQAMRDQGVSQVALAERLKCDPKQVRRLLDLDHQSRMNLVEAALRDLGKTLVVDVRETTAV